MHRVDDPKHGTQVHLNRQVTLATVLQARSDPCVCAQASKVGHNLQVAPELAMEGDSA